MAELMSHADLAIGAAGATTWERCCLGLPTIQIVTAENQRRIAEDLAKDNIIKLLNDVSELPEVLKDIESWITPLANSAKHVTDGLGVKRVVDYMLQGYQL
jgi:spore coat polysaccharide biosynthesis predicted glycosyltransferase SpsG